jgi:heterodisulfide reductase subunit A-like polyferredoxin
MFRKIKTLGWRPKKALIAAVVAISSTLKATSMKKAACDDMYDVAVIGGGSGGLATAFEAANHGLKTIVIDYV